VIDILREEYPVTELCRQMGVNRSGYYKWRARKDTLNQHEKDRKILTEMLWEAHRKHCSYGYHRLAAMVRQETGWLFSDNLAHKCCKYAGIRAKVSHYNWRRPQKGQEHWRCPNRIRGQWNAKRPMELVVSDMTHIRHKGRSYEWTYLLDTFNNEIISSHISGITGDRRPYFRCLEDLIQKAKEQADPVTLHTDQGSVYSSQAFYDAHKQYNIIRSMSRAGTPTDNPVIEAVNGWIKAEIYSEGWHHKFDTAEEMISSYVDYYNNKRLAYALQYKSPVQFKLERGFG